MLVVGVNSQCVSRHSGPGNKRQYEVKRDALPQFRPFFFHYGRSDLTKVSLLWCTFDLEVFS